MGCGETLFLSMSGKVRCSNVDCSEPYAIHEILTDPETEHIVMLTEQSFHVKHPLRERVWDQQLACGLGDWLVEQGRPPAGVGLFRVWWDGTGHGNWVRI